MSSTSIRRAGVVLVSILGLFLAGCEATSAAALGNSQPCSLTAPGTNIYRISMYDSVRKIYAQWARTQGASDLSILQPIRNQAFALLVDEVKRWTSAVDVPNDNTNVIRITVTYISPELAHVIILNHQLYKNFLPETQFEQSLIERMTEIANREELIFLMTITYSAYNPEVPTELNRMMITMPMDSVMLTNSENMQVHVHSVDPHLRQEIIISKGPSAGYVTFPMG